MHTREGDREADSTSKHNDIEAYRETERHTPNAYTQQYTPTGIHTYSRGIHRNKAGIKGIPNREGKEGQQSTYQKWGPHPHAENHTYAQQGIRTYKHAYTPSVIQAAREAYMQT